MAVVRSLDAWRALERATALHTLIQQRHLTPSCGGHAPTAERTVADPELENSIDPKRPKTEAELELTGRVRW
jgi:hypothetical protein